MGLEYPSPSSGPQTFLSSLSLSLFSSFFLYQKPRRRIIIIIYENR
jgi:hypothetical protein